MVILAYKGFDKDFKCRGFQYEIGETYEISGEIKCCYSGFHACENPSDVLTYYPITRSRFAKVKMEGDIEKKDCKLCASKITILEEICVEDYIDLCKSKNNHAEYNFSTLAQADITEYFEQIGSTGDYTNIISRVYGSQIFSSGNYAKIVILGCNHTVVSRGDSAHINVSADFTRISSEGIAATIICSGSFNLIRAKKGSWIILISGSNRDSMYAKAEKVDGKRIKEDTWYELRNGKFIERR